MTTTTTSSVEHASGGENEQQQKKNAAMSQAFFFNRFVACVCGLSACHSLIRLSDRRLHTSAARFAFAAAAAAANIPNRKGFLRARAFLQFCEPSQHLRLSHMNILFFQANFCAFVCSFDFLKQNFKFRQISLVVFCCCCL